MEKQVKAASEMEEDYLRKSGEKRRENYGKDYITHICPVTQR